MPKTVTKKTNAKTKKKKTATSAKQKPKSTNKGFGFFRFILSGCLFTIIFTLIIVSGISYFIVYKALSPTTSSRITEESYAYMYSEYPFLKRWTKNAIKHKELKDIYIMSEDSVRLHAFYIKAKKTTRDTAVIVHGYGGNAISMLHIAYLYSNDLGFNVLIPDLRTSGESGGDHIQMGWNDRKDVMRWMEEANNLFGGDTRMVVHGISMGAATVMMVAGEKQPDYVKAYIEDCGYTGVWDEIAHVAKKDYGVPEMPFLHIADQFCQWKYGWSFKEASCIEQLKKAERPMLFIHGEADSYVPTDMVYELYQAKKNNKEIWTLPGVMHARAYHDQKEEYTRRVEAFLHMFLYK